MTGTPDRRKPRRGVFHLYVTPPEGSEWIDWEIAAFRPRNMRPLSVSLDVPPSQLLRRVKVTPAKVGRPRKKK